MFFGITAVLLQAIDVNNEISEQQLQFVGSLVIFICLIEMLMLGVA